MRFIGRWPGPPPTDKKGFLEKLVKSAVFHKDRGTKGLVYVTPDLDWEFYLDIEISDYEADRYVIGVISCFRHIDPKKKKKARYRDRRAREKREDREELKDFQSRKK